jgi:hypothetical protein
MIIPISLSLPFFCKGCADEKGPCPKVRDEEQQTVGGTVQERLTASSVQDVPAAAPAAGPLQAAGSQFSNQPLVATRSPLPQTLSSSQLYPPYLHSQAAVPLPKRLEPAVCGQSLSQQPAPYRVMGLPRRVPQTSSLSQQQVLRPLAPHP